MTTIKDLAKASGYSITTISKALNNAPDIPQRTALKIQILAEEMGYIRNEYAANLARKHSQNIAIIVRTDGNNNYIDEISAKISISAALEAHKLGLDAVTLYDDLLKDFNAQELEHYLKLKKISGLILFGVDRPHQNFEFLLNNNDFKKVLIDIPTWNESTSGVSIPNVEAQYEFFKALVTKHSFKKILYFAGHHESFVGIERTFGVRKYQNEFTNVSIKIVESLFSQKKAINLLKVENLAEYDAIICANDLVAVTIKNYLLKNNSPQKNITIAGFDGLGLLDYLPYSIPTVKQDHSHMAILAVNELKRLLLDTEAHGKLIFDEFQLINI